jgi:hypothetical protein
MGQKAGEKWTAAVDLQPTIPKSDRLLARRSAFSWMVMLEQRRRKPR